MGTKVEIVVSSPSTAWEMLRDHDITFANCDVPELAVLRWQKVVVADSMKLLGKPNLSNFFPGLARFDLQGLKKQLLGIVMRFNRIFDAITDKGPRLKGGRQNKDFLQVLL
ncbi:Ent-cassadiene C11-alpha-hydroxylase 1 [Camellia lanceoleosa]|uniref:Ent-cassadiene C11-alpha-hydroxylase 1 n=1 Tax=Camellia lanceoleosa TaxID=1840588 RepID=A0ACC0G2U0_9ERIC|nr:Ent-cassadiene C11-alpha-hydroxylase 1 [Camellia lanceoleosa]